MIPLVIQAAVVSKDSVGCPNGCPRKLASDTIYTYKFVSSICTSALSEVHVYEEIGLTMFKFKSVLKL